MARHRALLERESDEALRALVARSYACGYAQRWVNVSNLAYFHFMVA